jgi:two-component system sensor histidine kinase AgrC
MGNSINSVIIITIEMITCRMLYESFVVRKKNITDKVYNMSMVILIGVMFIISRILKTYIPVKLLAGMIAIVIYMYIMEQISIIKSAAIALIYYSVAIVLDYLVMLIMISIFGSLENVGNISETAGNSLIILSRAVFLLITIFLRQYSLRKNVNRVDVSNSDCRKLLFFPVFTVFIVIALSGTMMTMDATQFAVIYYVIAVGVVIMDIIMFYLVKDIIMNSYKLRENEVLKQQAAGQIELYRTVSENFDRQRRKTHEYKNQMLCIETLAENGEYDKLKSYVKSITGNLNRELDMIDTNNKIVNAVLNAKYHEAVDNNILMVFKINDLSGINILDEDIVQVLSNLLDNAIEAARQCDINHRLIKLKFTCEDAHTILSVSNTYKYEPQITDDGYMITRKEEKQEHGFGLRNVMAVLDKYNARHVIRCESGEFFFAMML